jgi:uncharacterized iron-regulated protein
VLKVILTIKESVVKVLFPIALSCITLSCASDPNAHFALESLTPTEKVAFESANVVLLGEQHDNPVHHQIQAEVLRRLGEEGRLRAVIFEQVDWEYQGILMQANSDNLDQLAQKLDWANSGWPAWDMYRPLFETAVRYKAKLVAGGLPKNRVPLLYNSGYEIAFSAAEIERIRLRQPLDEMALRSVRAEIYEGHCKLIPEDQVEKMVPVQRARDGALTKGYLREADLSGVSVFILGNAHARKEFGVPTLLRAVDPKLKIWSLGMQEIQSQPFPPEAFDKVWITPSVERDDPCAAMKHHVETKAQPSVSPKALKDAEKTPSVDGSDSSEPPPPVNEPAAKPSDSPAADEADEGH